MKATMNKYSNQEIASDYNLWITYVDPFGVDTESAFNAMSEGEKVAIIVSCFGKDE